MGGELAERRTDLYARYLGEAEQATGLPLTTICREGPIDELTRTEVAQPAIFAVSTALSQLAKEFGIRPDFVAGHSLGEYTAAVCSGGLSWDEGIRLVALRGRLMAEAQAQRAGAMGVVSGLQLENLEATCAAAEAEGLVVVANHNSDRQFVVSGAEPAVERVLAMSREAGAEQAIRLQVGAAFHSPLMEAVEARLATELNRTRFADPEVPVVVNHTGAIVHTADQLRSALIQHVTRPVRWSACVRALMGAGCTSFLELGPGRVLTGLARKIDHDLDAAAADSPKKLETYLSTHPNVVEG